MHLARHILLASALSLSGCVPVAWVTPPVKLEAGVGISRVDVQNDPGRAGARPLGHVEIKASLPPLQLFPELEWRSFDVGFGYGARLFFPAESQLLHGPFLETYALIYPAQARGRLGFGGLFHALGDSSGAYAIQGGKLGVRAFWEWDNFSDAPFDACDSGDFCGGGYAFGEASFGFYAEVANTILSEQMEQSFTLGIMGRIPASVGVGLLFLDLSDVL